MNRIAVKKDVLEWAIERVGLTPTNLVDKFPKILKWIAGDSQPTLHQLESLSNSTLTPLGFFFLASPPDERLPISYFRTISSETPKRFTPDLLETVQVMQRRQSWLREFLIEQGQNPLHCVRSIKEGDTPVLVANNIRKELNFDDNWASREVTWTNALYTLRKAMEEIGIIVVVNGIVGNNTHRKLNPNEFRGFVLVDDYAPFVFVNGADGKAAQMFTLAHELAHVFLGSSAAFDLRNMQPADDPNEQKCNIIAAEFLVPEIKLKQVWTSVKKDTNPFQAIAKQFKVSELVAARRALDIGLITKDRFFEFYNAYKSDERRKSVQQSDGGNFYFTQNLRLSHRFASTVVQATREAKMLYTEAYNLTGLYGKTFERYASFLNIGGRK